MSKSASQSTGNIYDAYQCASANKLSAGTPRPSQRDTSEASITDLLQYLELIFKTYGGMRAGRPDAIAVVCDSHSDV